jgi:hypothetical protein
VGSSHAGAHYESNVGSSHAGAHNEQMVHDLESTHGSSGSYHRVGVGSNRARSLKIDGNIVINIGAEDDPDRHALTLQDYHICNASLEKLDKLPRSSKYQFRDPVFLKKVFVYVRNELGVLETLDIVQHFRILQKIVLAIISIVGLFARDNDTWSAFRFMLGHNISPKLLGDLVR